MQQQMQYKAAIHCCGSDSNISERSAVFDGNGAKQFEQKREERNGWSSAGHDRGMGSKRGATFKIEPLKQKVALDPEYANKTWAVLEDAIDRINKHNASGLSFEELYRSAYNMVLHKHGDSLYAGVHSSLSSHLRSVATDIGSHANSSLASNSNRKSNRSSAADGECLLNALISQWAAFNKSMRMIRDILIYMDRTYVPNNDKKPVHELGLSLWNELVLQDQRIGPTMTSTVLSMVHAERIGERIERDMLKSVSKMLTDLGQNVYEEWLEQQLLQTSASFYSTEAHELLTTSDCRTYLKRAESRIAEEQARVHECFNSNSEPKLMRVVYDELLRKHVHTLVSMPNSGLIAMTDAEDTESLSRMHQLLSRVEGGAQAMRDSFSSYLKDHGDTIVRSLVANDEGPVRFIGNLLRLKDLSQKVLRESFENDNWFQIAANTAFEASINSTTKSPEYLSLFIDDRLRRGLKASHSESELEDVLDRAVLLFRHLRDKDLFERYYRQHLRNRLLNSKQLMEEQERGFVQRLKTQCGYAFTSKIEQMFTDVTTTSRELMRAFKDMSADDESIGIDLNVEVLTTGSWPINPQPGSPWLPREIQPAASSFESFYYERHHGRQLSWNVCMGTATVRAEVSKGSRYELYVSTLQMCVLLLFNEYERLSVGDIERLLDISVDEIQPAVYELACVKGRNVLLKHPHNEEVSESDKLEVNEQFSSKSSRLRIGVSASQRESSAETSITKHKVEEDRKPQIEAAIVRLMKSRKSMDHTSLVNEVTRQLSWYFVPHVSAIKERIEQLVEREFLERGANLPHCFSLFLLQFPPNCTI